MSSYDYNDKDELSQAWALLKGRCITIARLLARRFSSLCLQKCGELLISQLQVGTASDATLSLLDNVSFCALTCRDLNDPDITSFGDGHEVLAALPEEQKHRVAASTAVALQLTSALVSATNSLHQFYAAALSPIVGSLTPAHVARETWFAPALASPSSADNIEAAKLERERLQHVLAILVVTFRRAKH